MSTETSGSEGTTSRSEGPNVTFVGGKAIEQTETLGSQLSDDEHAAAKEAVRKAISEAATKAGEDSAESARSDRAKDPYKPPGTTKEVLERGPDGKFLPKEGADKKAPESESDDEALDLDKASVKQILKAREKVANLKRDAKDELSKERQAFQAEVSQFRQFAEQVKAENVRIARDRESINALKKDPGRAIREIGYDPEQFILDLAQEGTPEGMQKRQFAELQAQIAEMKAWKQEQLNERQRQAHEAQMAHATAFRTQAVNDFLKLGLDDEKYPHVATFYKGRQKHLIAAGDLTAEEYRNLSGKEGSYEQILDYLEDELADSANAWYSKRSSGGQKGVPGSQPKPQPKSSKGKSLSPDASGERRALVQKDLNDLDGDERHEAARQAVRVALAASRD